MHLDKSGILLVDKPSGPTSHDIVARVRRAFRGCAVGHAGTLDPMASGLLVVAIGEGTKLVQFLTDHDKIYEAEVSFGRSTDTLDAQGATICQAAVPTGIAAELEAFGRGAEHTGPLWDALEAERRRVLQVPPSFAAIKQGGRPVYERARRGETVVLPPRPVCVRDLTVVGAKAADACSLTLRVCVTKGYYVRSLARDLGEAVGVPAHLSRLRRLESGPFSVGDSLALPASDEGLWGALVDVTDACRRILPTATLTEEGARFAFHGKLLGPTNFQDAVPDGLSAWFDPRGNLVAVGRFESSKSALVVIRGFRYAISSDST